LVQVAKVTWDWHAQKLNRLSAGDIIGDTGLGELKISALFAIQNKFEALSHYQSMSYCDDDFFQVNNSPLLVKKVKYVTSRNLFLGRFGKTS